MSKYATWKCCKGTRSTRVGSPQKLLALFEVDDCVDNQKSRNLLALFEADDCVDSQKSRRLPGGFFDTCGNAGSAQSRTPWNSIFVISYVTRPLGMSMDTSSPTSCPSKALPTGELMEMDPLA